MSASYWLRLVASEHCFAGCKRDDSAALDHEDDRVVDRFGRELVFLIEF